MIGELVKITRGDDIPFEFSLTRNRAAISIDSGATVRAWIINDSSGTAVGPVLASAAATGANWGVGLVVVTFPAATTSTCGLGISRVELEVDDGGLLTWHFPNFLVVDGQS